jgi:hypothetical protein
MWPPLSMRVKISSEYSATWLGLGVRGRVLGHLIHRRKVSRYLPYHLPYVSATLSWMYILPPALFFCSRESA